MAITTADIHSAADSLVAEGKAPTLVNVRALLGSGSYSTLSAGMASWREHQAAQPAPMQEPPPAAVADKFNGLLAEVWGAALGMANARLATEREALDAARIELERERQEAAELAEQVSADLEQTRQERDRVTMDRDAALAVSAEQDQKLVQLATEVAGAQSRAALAEQRADDNAKRADDLSRALQAEQANARAERDQAAQQLREAAQAAQVRAASAREQHATLTVQLEAVYTERNQATQQLKEATQAAQAAQVQQATLAGQLEAVQGELNAERDQRNNLAQIVENRAREAGRWQEEQQRLRGTVQALTSAFANTEHSPEQAGALYAAHQVLGVTIPNSEIPQKSGKVTEGKQQAKKK